MAVVLAWEYRFKADNGVVAKQVKGGGCVVGAVWVCETPVTTAVRFVCCESRNALPRGLLVVVSGANEDS